ncbi:M14 family metallopeptidase [Flavobacterium facile]|uniref:M14 family metallopeptidase n=1 Tax=Flavobacterium facile TaxID=2893174 RepID=UPI002E79853F|nr:M14 metallopeptidase family protein [Flavobacterium sp. T-12]
MKDNLQLATEFLYSDILGRYVTMNHINPFLETLHSGFKISTVGFSVEKNPIKAIQFGEGKTKILVWSQMHGNESTTTKGLIDYLNYLNLDKKEFENITKNYTLYILPILNPDGAIFYTRENANKVDLNRDALDCSQPESKVLRNVLVDFNPDYCFNLHDQRTIFGLLESKKPATMSFLTASYNNEREFNVVRMKAAEVIVGIDNELQKFIPNQVGRFDDSFNINCTGDYFTNKGYPTILFEAGHYHNDYQRDIVRKYVFIALKSAISTIDENDMVELDFNNYLRIYQNNKCFYDFIFKNVKIIDNNVEKIIKFAVQYKEVLKNDEIEFIPEIIQVENLDDFYAHQTIDSKNDLFEFENRNFPKIGDTIKIRI